MREEITKKGPIPIILWSQKRQLEGFGFPVERDYSVANERPQLYNPIILPEQSVASFPEGLMDTGHHMMADTCNAMP